MILISEKTCKSSQLCNIVSGECSDDSDCKQNIDDLITNEPRKADPKVLLEIDRLVDQEDLRLSKQKQENAIQINNNNENGEDDILITSSQITKSIIPKSKAKNNGFIIFYIYKE